MFVIQILEGLFYTLKIETTLLINVTSIKCLVDLICGITMGRADFLKTPFK